MNMISAGLNDLCQSISVSVANARFLLRSQAQLSEILDCFWGLQDRLGRLVDEASDQPLEVFDFLSREHPQLLRDVIGSLSMASREGVARNAAVGSSCEAINELLLKLETFKPLSRSSVAGS